ncbi:restriction endonuclease subunit S [Providencia alcalifaciens]|uniref:restriction endonuclease subunit S n=1 Tax=Proteus TaxID=583 RepID=UPI001F063411|nr:MULTISPECIES: restriction endonuclease subunit S [Proteus]MCT0127789.1 restriction endonuclease subunit S [Proteus mirabilis]UXA33258.1 restriction endonuclease subunit S [Proteus terrae]
MSVEVTETGLNLIPAGYKQTEVGVIPKDWEISQLRDLLKTPPKYGINAPAVPLEGKLPVYIRITDISEDGYFKPSEKVGVKSQFSSQYQLANGDIVLARTGASVGKSYLYKEHDGTLIYAGFLIKVSPDKNILEPRFLSQYLQTQRYWSWVNVNSMRSGQPGINGNEYGSLLVPLPKIDEQTAIANALSDVDALISELEKLIAKKQAIKTATMQQLLTGRTRLPQFALREDGSKKGTKQSELGEIPEDWRVVILGDISNLNMGQSPSSGNYNAKGIGLPLIQGNADISNRKTIIRNYTSQITKKANKGDLLISVRAPVGEVAIAEFDCCIGRGVCAIRYPNSYLYHWLINFESQWEKFSKGSTFDSINSDELRTIQLVLPSNEEQTAIASILSDMDDEIQALEQRLGKTRQIKQGMMQELLTGKTRLPYDKE